MIPLISHFIHVKFKEVSKTFRFIGTDCLVDFSKKYASFNSVL